MSTHIEELDRLWRAFRRDLCTAIEEVAGVHDSDKTVRRLMRNWDKLCELDLEIASHLHHGITEIGSVMADRMLTLREAAIRAEINDDTEGGQR